MRSFTRGDFMRVLVPVAACFIFTACVEDDGPVNMPIEGEEAAENYGPGDPGASGGGGGGNSTSGSLFGASSADSDGDGILNGTASDIGGDACAQDTNMISESRSLSCSLIPASNGMGTADPAKVGVQVEKKESEGGRVLTQATEDKPCGEGGEYTVTSSGSVTICSETCTAIKENEDYDAVSAFLGCE
jgi:hypothetical protein